MQKSTIFFIFNLKKQSTNIHFKQVSSLQSTPVHSKDLILTKKNEIYEYFTESIIALKVFIKYFDLYVLPSNMYVLVNWYRMQAQYRKQARYRIYSCLYCLVD